MPIIAPGLQSPTPIQNSTRVRAPGYEAPKPRTQSPATYNPEGLSGTPAGLANYYNFAGNATRVTPLGGGITSGGGTSYGGGPITGGGLTGGGIAGGIAGAAGGTTNTAQADPNLAKYTGVLDNRINTLTGYENAGISADVDRMVSKSQGNIAATTAGAQQGMAEQMAARGIGGSGIAGAAATQLGEAAQRNMAGAGADIQLEMQKRKDELDLARRNQTNQMIGGGLQAAVAPAQLAIQQQGLLLQQAAQAQAAEFERIRLQQAQAQQTMSNTMNLAGIANTFRPTTSSYTPSTVRAPGGMGIIRR